MQHPISDLLGTSLVPELGSDVAAGTACDKELVLVAVAAVRALPHQLASLILNNLDLAVIATLLTEITLGVQLRIHNIIVDKLHHRENCRNISLHIRHLDVADRTARGKLLELCLKFQLTERVNLLGYVYMVAVRDIVLIRNARNDTEALLQSF